MWIVCYKYNINAVVLYNWTRLGQHKKLRLLLFSLAAHATSNELWGLRMTLEFCLVNLAHYSGNKYNDNNNSVVSSTCEQEDTFNTDFNAVSTPEQQ